MNHRRNLRKFGRDSSHRLAMLKNMVKNLVRHERIQTTLAKAKDTRRVAEKAITTAKKGTEHARNQLMGFFWHDTSVVDKLMTDIAPRFAEREGGYTRIIKAPNRRGDWAPMAFIEYVERPGVVQREVVQARLAAAKKDDQQTPGQQLVP
eukprot:tig00000663_g2952.t1